MEHSGHPHGSDALLHGIVVFAARSSEYLSGTLLGTRERPGSRFEDADPDAARCGIAV
jgi:hypothetical protein